MSQQQTILAIIERGSGMVRKHLADFSDSDMFTRVAPTANHAAYQLAHLLRTTSGMVKAVDPGATVTLPPKVEGDAKAPPTSDDPGAFPSKEELIGALEAMTASVAAAVGKMSEADFDKPTPEPFKGFAPTVGQLSMMVPLHMTMHVGQFQAIRRKLGKPVLF